MSVKKLLAGTLACMMVMSGVSTVAEEMNSSGTDPFYDYKQSTTSIGAAAPHGRG